MLILHLIIVIKPLATLDVIGLVMAEIVIDIIEVSITDVVTIDGIINSITLI
jgi:hypothetical protein